MDKFIIIGGGMPFKMIDLGLLMDRDNLIQKSLINSLVGGDTNSPGIPCILSGLVESSVGGTVIISNGYYFDGQEIFFVTGGSFTYVDDYHYYLVSDFTGQQTRTFHNGYDHYCWSYRRYQIQYAGSPLEGYIDMTNIKRLIDLLSEQIAFPEQISSPCTGSKYIEFRKGIKYVSFAPIQAGQIYYISSVKRGVGASNPKTYEVKISKVDSLNAAGTVVGVFSMSTSTQQNGEKIIGIIANSGLSAGETGISGSIVIDWDEFELGQNYSCTSWQEGSLMSIIPPSTASGGGSSTIGTLTDGSVAIKGGSPLVLLDASTIEDYCLDAPESIEGDINLKNISTHEAHLTAPSGTTIDGHVTIIIASMANVTLKYIDSRFFVVAGTYTY
ncbi:MAG: hypothetical protein WCL00_05190 [Bacteroidota bacterium]